MLEKARTSENFLLDSQNIRTWVGTWEYISLEETKAEGDEPDTIKLIS